jgi:ABC-type transporter Mla MlaB component
VDELIKIWAGLFEAPRKERAVRIDLDAISYVDECGKTVLAVLRNAGCELHGSAPYIASVIGEVAASSPSA